MNLVRTFHTLVAGLKIPDEVLRALAEHVELLVRDVDLALALTGALPVRQQQDIGGAPQIAKVLLDASGNFGATVERAGHDDYFIRAALGAERVPLAVGICEHTENICFYRTHCMPL